MNNDNVTAGSAGSFYKFAASFSQQRLWFIDRYESDSSHYNISRVFRLSGQLNQSVLFRSINEIVRRHEVMRTIFVEEDGAPVQLVASQLTLQLPLIDLSSMPGEERTAEADRLIREESQYVFNLEKGPLLRFCLLQLDKRDYILIITMHHIISDAWSITVLNREIMAFYNAYIEDEPPLLTDLPIQYADFALWQREQLQGDLLAQQLEYWRKKLAGVPILKLPADRHHDEKKSFAGASHHVHVSAQLTRDLHRLSQSHGATLFMTLLAVFQLQLHRISNQNDIAVGSPIAGRNRTEIEPLIGFFVNTLVFRTDLSGNPAFDKLLGRVRETCLGGYAHQDIPFEKLVEELKPERDLIRNPFFDVLINYTEHSFDVISLQGMEVELLEYEQLMSLFPLTLYIMPARNDEGLELEMVYQISYFSSERIRILLDQYLYLLEQVVAAPGQPIELYSLVTSEARSLLPDPARAIHQIPNDTVVNMLYAIADASPDRIAINMGDIEWTYSDLIRCSGGLAAFLRTRGFGSGDVLAVTGQRSIGLISSILAVLMCEGILLLIDENLPDERKKLILSEASAKTILSIAEGQGKDLLYDHNSSLPLITISAIDGSFDGKEVCKNSIPDTRSLPSPESAAYIFFTSGSSGIPKAVLGCHKCLSHFIKWQISTFGIGPGDRVSQLTGLSFDVILRDVFLPLCSGGTLCIPTDKDMLNVLRWLEQKRITTVHTVPTLLHTWLADIQTEIDMSNLRWIFLAGEPLGKVLVNKWRAAFPDNGNIVNLYGATETTLVKTYYLIPKTLDADVQPIGYPLPQTQVLVLSEQMQLCGIGEPGEIVIRTPYRSLGYVNSADENAKRFVKNPFRDDEKDIIYLTGDFGRYRPNGILEYLGRIDDQVKIRGVRVEPSEVTAILSRHSKVDICIVIARKDDTGQYNLIAYVVPIGCEDNLRAELIAYLKTLLPAVMMPASYVFLERLPVLSNGKVDRQALPKPEQDPVVLADTYKAPRNELEKRLVAIWEDVLRKDRVGIDDNFFEIGGHSLLATRVMSRINQSLVVEIPLRSLFEMPTIEKLSLLVGSHLIGGKDARENTIPKISRASRKNYDL